MPFRKPSSSLRLTSFKLPPKRLLVRPWLPNFQLKRMPSRLPLKLRLNSKELLQRRLELSSLLSKLEMMRLLQLLPKPPSKLHSNRRPPLPLSPKQLNLKESPLLSTTKFKLPSRISRDNRLLRPLFSLKLKHLSKKPRELLSSRLKELLLRLRPRLFSKRKLPRPLLPKPRLKLLLLKRNLMKTQLPLRFKPRLLLREKDSKKKLLIPLSMSKKWPPKP